GHRPRGPGRGRAHRGRRRRDRRGREEVSHPAARVNGKGGIISRPFCCLRHVTRYRIRVGLWPVQSGVAAMRTVLSFASIACSLALLSGNASLAAEDRLYDSEKGQLKVGTVASGLEFPWSLAFLPDGRMLVTERRSEEH